ncbi:hypothetical protein FKM82_012082 [Ascaphus truei]
MLASVNVLSLDISFVSHSLAYDDSMLLSRTHLGVELSLVAVTKLYTSVQLHCDADTRCYGNGIIYVMTSQRDDMHLHSQSGCVRPDTICELKQLGSVAIFK